MKFSAPEEYGLRCLLQLALLAEGENRSIQEISRAERVSVPYAAKLMCMLRRGGFVESVRGKDGGYRLARAPRAINLGEVLAHLGGKLFEPDFCHRHAGDGDRCSHSPACRLRPLWLTVQTAVDRVLKRATLADLLPRTRRRR